MKDEALGDKRLASMPDRVTNTIHAADATTHFRPTVINCFRGDLSTAEKWWREWKRFMFVDELSIATATGASKSKAALMLQKIKQSKYPAITREEEAISLPLQTLALAIFDAVLVHILNSVSPDAKWQKLRVQMCDALNSKKDERTLQILSESYADAQVIFLQEAAASILARARASELGPRYELIHSGALDGKRDQNTVILLRRDTFNLSSVQEHTARVLGYVDHSTHVANGDLLVVSVADTSGRMYLLASFHGDTNGLATRPLLAALHQLHQSMPQHRLIFGLDANTYEKGIPGKKQDVLEFAADYVSKGLTSCWGDTPNPLSHTTYNARTFLQAQLQKAARSNELQTKGDKNPKDFILFPKWAFTPYATRKDNTGRREYIEQMVFPTLEFPSDHGIISTTLKVVSAGVR